MEAGGSAESGASRAGSEGARFWAAAAVVLGILIYTGIRWIPPVSPEAPAKQPVPVTQVLEVTVHSAPLLNLNEATAEELEQLRGIGPVLARRIVEYRRERGPFGSLEELTEVSGIGPAVLDGVRDQIKVD